MTSVYAIVPRRWFAYRVNCPSGLATRPLAPTPETPREGLASLAQGTASLDTENSRAKLLAQGIEFGTRRHVDMHSSAEPCVLPLGRRT